VNLAPPEALHRVAALAEAADASVILSERGDAQPLPRHPNFRLLAAMNPATGGHSQMVPFAIHKDKRVRLRAGAITQQCSKLLRCELTQAVLNSKLPLPCRHTAT
jgi:hypothetical protein